MKRVCILTSGHPPYDDRVFYKEARSLKRAGLHVSLICSTGNYDEVTEGIRVRGFKTDPFLIGILVGRITKLVYLVGLALRERCAVYHCHEFGPLLAAHIAKWVRSITSSCEGKVVYDVHEWFPWSLSWEPNLSLWNRVRSLVYHKFHAFLCNLTDHIIVNEELKVSLYRDILTHSRVTTVENFPPLDLFLPQKKEFSKGRFVVAYAGGLSRERGIHELARATQIFSRHTSVRPRLLLVGDFYAPQEGKEFAKAFEDVEFDLEITGWQPHPEVPAFLRDADVCVIPWQHTQKFSRSLPVKLYEYMALFKPIVASNFGEMQKVILESSCGLLVDPSNPQKIADALVHYYRNPNQMHDHAKNGRYWVEKKFNWAEAEKKLLSVYSRLNASGHQEGYGDKKPKGDLL